MKKIGKSAELLWVFGILFVSFGVAMCKKADLGVSMIAAPTFIVHEAISPIFPFISVGTTEYIVQGILLIMLCITVRRVDWKYLLAFAVAVIYGYSLDLFIFLLRDLTVSSVVARYLMLLSGDIVVGFGVACFFHTYMPLQVHELFVSELTLRFKLKLNRVKSAFDIALLIVSLALAFLLFGDVRDLELKALVYSSFHSIGPGTIITTFINAPIIALMSRLVDRIFLPTAAFPALEALLKRK